MEPPAVTSCGVSHSALVGNSQHIQAQKRENVPPVSFLQIDPQISFNTPSRHFEELPENFLETISPQQHAGHSSIINIGGEAHDGIIGVTTSPQLASLTTVSMAAGVSPNTNSGYGNLIPMPSSSHYISTLKMESMEHLTHHPQLHQTNQLDKATFGNGPADLLSPLQLESNRSETTSLNLLGSVHHHRPNGGSRTSDLLSGIRRNNVSYIKEEINPTEIGYQTTHDYDTGYSLQQPTPQELERMANAETPPALSNVEITSSILVSLSRDSPSPNMQQQNQTPTHFIVHQMPRHSQQQPQSQQQQHIIHSTQSIGSRSRKSKQSQQQQQDALQRLAAKQNANINIDSYGAIEMSTGSYPPSSIADPLNAEIDDEIYIDTKDLCKRVAYELKQHSIPQAIFAERILCRSQGTLSDLLRNPKPWNRLKSGRETFKRMYNWLQQPLHVRLNILDMYKDDNSTPLPINLVLGPMASGGIISPPTPAQNSRHHHRRRTSDDGQAQKRPRLVFTDIQKRTLQAIFKETQRPSREMQQTIAEHLKLDMSTVSNFFMNARRRSRNGSGMGADEPAPYQQIRTITPPPDSPPTAQQHQIFNNSDQSPTHHPHHQLSINRSGRAKSSISYHYHPTTSAANLSHIEQTVDEVVGRSMAYARKAQYAPPVSQEVMEQPPIWEEEVQTEIPHPFSMEEPDEHAEIDDIDGMDADSSENTEIFDGIDDQHGMENDLALGDGEEVKINEAAHAGDIEAEYKPQRNEGVTDTKIIKHLGKLSATRMEQSRKEQSRKKTDHLGKHDESEVESQTIDEEDIAIPNKQEENEDPQMGDREIPTEEPISLNRIREIFPVEEPRSSSSNNDSNVVESDSGPSNGEQHQKESLNDID